MAPTSAIVLYAVVWFMVMFVTLPLRRRTQGDDGNVVPGTPAGAPTNFSVGRTMVIVTAVAFVVWGIICAVIITGVVNVRDLKTFG